MKATPRQTAFGIQQEYKLLKEQVIQTIHEIIEEKQIKHIELHSDYHITSYYLNSNNYFTIKDIDSDGVFEYENTQYNEFENKSFEQLEITTLLEILELLEGDITMLTKGEEEDEEEDDEDDDEEDF